MSEVRCPNCKEFVYVQLEHCDKCGAKIFDFELEPETNQKLDMHYDNYINTAYELPAVFKFFQIIGMLMLLAGVGFVGYVVYYKKIIANTPLEISILIASGLVILSLIQIYKFSNRKNFHSLTGLKETPIKHLP